MSTGKYSSMNIGEIGKTWDEKEYGFEGLGEYQVVRGALKILQNCGGVLARMGHANTWGTQEGTTQRSATPHIARSVLYQYCIRSCARPLLVLYQYS